jgi:hypothetical protein
MYVCMYVSMYNEQKVFKTGYISAVESSKQNTGQGKAKVKQSHYRPGQALNNKKILYRLTRKLCLCMLNSEATLPLQVGVTDGMSL